MRNRRPHPDHEAAVARRLALLGAELAGTRAEHEAPDLAIPATDEEWWRDHTRMGTPAEQRVGELPSWDAAPTGAIDAPAAPPPDTEPPVDIPVPGRHASRRARPGLAALVPGPLRGRGGLGAGALAVVAVLVALGLAVTCWWVVRSDSSEQVGRLVATEASPAAGGASASAGGAAAGTAVTGAPVTGASSPGAGAEAGTVTVDVAGRVRRPGIAVLPAGARVVDALEAAGGARPGVDLIGLNLARVLVDGEQLLVGVEAPAGAAVPPGGTVAPGAPGAALVNINLAGEAELDTLPGVGPVTAGAIIAWREEHGGFSAIEELLEVDGIGEATLADLTPLVTV